MTVALILDVSESADLAPVVRPDGADPGEIIERSRIGVARGPIALPTIWNELVQVPASKRSIARVRSQQMDVAGTVAPRSGRCIWRGRTVTKQGRAIHDRDGRPRRRYRELRRRRSRRRSNAGAGEQKHGDRDGAAHGFR